MTNIALKGVPNFDNFEIVKTGTIFIDSDHTILTGQQSFEINHGLGYIPTVLAYLTNETGNIIIPLPDNGINSSGVATYLFTAVTTITQLIINQYTFSNGLGPSYVKYYLLRRAANI